LVINISSSKPIILEVDVLRSARNLSDLTIIIPTVNRSRNLKRLLKFFGQTNVNLLILDGGENSRIPTNSIKVRYIHIKNSNLQERLFHAPSYLKTNYSVICADDDFLFPRGLETCLNFLKQNSNYASVQGMYIRIAEEKYFSWFPDYVHWRKVKLLEDDPTERVLNMKHSCQFLYAMMPIKTLRNVTRVFQDIEGGSLTMNELAFNYINNVSIVEE